jgi:adenine-specific DNA-methyltransferase
MYGDDYPIVRVTNYWDDVRAGGFGEAKIYVVQTTLDVVERCILMSTDPGDLVLDPTCGSGTTAYVAEQWGRRWITIDTSRVALALARARIMGARYPWYILADSPEGQRKEWEVSGKPPPSLRGGGADEAIQNRDGWIASPSARNDERGTPRDDEKSGTRPTRGDIRHGFVYERVPHITLKSIANNDRDRRDLGPVSGGAGALRAALNTALGTSWEEWEVPRTLAPHPDPLPRGEREGGGSVSPLPSREREGPAQREGEGDRPEAEALLAQWWAKRIARQKEIDASIAAKAEVEYLYDKPYPDPSRVRVAGPFTVETLSPHRVLAVSHDDELIDTLEAANGRRPAPERSLDEADFAEVILENLKTSGVQQAHKEDRITFTGITGWPGNFICAEGRFMEGDRERRDGIFIGPEFGTVARPDLVAAAREAGDAGFDVLIACAFNYDAHSAEFDKLGRIPILKARMSADLHMAGELKNTGRGNLFVIFGEPDIEIQDAAEGQMRVKINGVDVFHPQTGEIASSGPEGIACWFIDTDYNEESFFVRHAYFLGANNPYKALKTTLKAEIDEDAWESLNSDVSRPFDKPGTGRIAVKVI